MAMRRGHCLALWQCGGQRFESVGSTTAGELGRRSRVCGARTRPRRSEKLAALGSASGHSVDQVRGMRSFLAALFALDAGQEAVECADLVAVQVGEECGFQVGDGYFDLGCTGLAGLGDLNDVPASVGWVALALGQPIALKVVEEADQHGV